MARDTRAGRTAGVIETRTTPNRTNSEPSGLGILSGRSPALEAGLGHADDMRSGLDGRTVAIGVLGVVVAVVLGGVAYGEVGAAVGALTALAGVAGSAVLAVAMEQWVRNSAALRRRQEILRKFALPRPSCDAEGEGE